MQEQTEADVYNQEAKAWYRTLTPEEEEEEEEKYLNIQFLHHRAQTRSPLPRSTTECCSYMEIAVGTQHIKTVWQDVEFLSIKPYGTLVTIGL